MKNGNTIKSIISILFLMAMVPLLGQTEGENTGVGVDERLGNIVPLDVVFKDESGNAVKLGDLITKPTILSLVYYHCPTVCKPLMAAKVDVVDRLTSLNPGKDFNMLTISFNPKETPVHARSIKDHFMQSFRKPIPKDAWRFLTGNREAIDKITNSVGYRYQPRGSGDFDHPVVIMILSPKGKIARYFYGQQYQPLNIKMGLIEAAEGRVGPTINKVLYYCFSYDPEGKTYAFSILKVTGTLTIFFLLLFVLWLVLAGRKKNKKESQGENSDSSS